MPARKGLINLITLYIQLKPWHNLPVSEIHICHLLHQLYLNKSWWFPVYYRTKQVETNSMQLATVSYKQHLLKIFGYKLVQLDEYDNISYKGRDSITILNKTFTMVRADMLLPIFKKFQS